MNDVPLENLEKVRHLLRQLKDEEKIIGRRDGNAFTCAANLIYTGAASNRLQTSFFITNEELETPVFARKKELRDD